METPLDDSGHWSVAAPQVGLSVVLACVRSIAEFCRTGISARCEISPADHCRFTGSCCRSNGFSRQAKTQVRAFHTWLPWCWRSSA